MKYSVNNSPAAIASQKTVQLTPLQIFFSIVIVCLMAIAITVPIVVTIKKETNTMSTKLSIANTATPTAATASAVITASAATNGSTTTTASAAITTSTGTTTASTTTATTASTTTTGPTVTSTTTTPNPYPCGNMTTLINADLSGHDLIFQVSISWASCCAWCLTNSTCGSFTWVISGQNCYLKTSISSNGTYNSNCVSAKFF